MVVCPLFALLILSLSSGLAPEGESLRSLHSAWSSFVVLLISDVDGISLISLLFFTGGRGEGMGKVDVSILGVVIGGVPPPLGSAHSFCFSCVVGLGGRRGREWLLFPPGVR